MLVCALAPIAQIGQHGPMTVLRRSGGALVESGGGLRSALVIVQMSACVVLVIGAALLFQGFRTALNSARGDRVGEPIVAVVEAAGRYGNPDAGRQYFARLEHEAKGAWQVASVDWISTLPGGRPSTATVRLEQAPAGTTHASIDAMTPSGRDLIAMTLKSGRPFGGQDSATSCPVVLVNEAAEAKYFQGAALGRSLRDSSDHRVDIAGVTKDTEDAKEPRVYFYERQTLATPSRDVEPKAFSLSIPPAEPAVSPEVDLDIDIASTGTSAPSARRSKRDTLSTRGTAAKPRSSTARRRRRTSAARRSARRSSSPTAIASRSRASSTKAFCVFCSGGRSRWSTSR